MKKHKVALDVDGVIADFYGGMCVRFGKEKETHAEWYMPWVVEKYPEIEGNADFILNLPVLNPPSSINFDFDLYLTALPKKLIPARIEWLKNNGFPDKPVVSCFDKIEYCERNSILVLIDDKPETLALANNSEIVTPIQFIPPYFNIEPICELNVRKLEDVKDCLEFLNIY